MDDESFDEEILLLILLRRRRKRRIKQEIRKKCIKRRFWVRPIFQHRDELGEYHRLVQELHERDREYFFRFVVIGFF